MTQKFAKNISYMIVIHTYALHIIYSNVQTIEWL